MRIRSKTFLISCATATGLIAFFYFSSTQIPAFRSNGGQGYLLIALVVTALSLILANSAVLERLFLSRLSRLTSEFEHIGESGDLDARLATDGGDEISRLAERVNGVLGGLETSQRKQLESGQRYRDIVQGTEEGILLLDTETKRVLESNAALQKLLGYTAKELSDLSLYDLVVQERSSIDENVLRLVAEKRQSFGERKYRCKSGSLVDAEINANVIAFGEKQVACLFVRDVTKRMWVEDALRRNEAYYRSLIDNSLDVTGILNSDGTVCYLSPSVERMLGFKPERLVGRNAFDMIHSDDAAMVRRLFSKGIQNPEFTTSVEYRLQHQDGSWVYVEASAHSLLENPAVMGIVFSMRDITARKEAEQRLRESEERYRQAVENSPNAIFSVDRGGKIQTWNRSCENIFQYGQEYIGRHLRELLADPADNSRLVAMLDKVFNKQALADVEISYRSRDGTNRHTTSRLYPLLDAAGRVEACVLANTDITDRKRGEVEIERRAHEFAALLETSRELAVPQDLPALLRTIVERATELLSAACGGIYLYDPVRGDLEVTVATHPAIPLGIRLGFGEGMAGRVAQSRQPLIVDDYQNWEGRSHKLEGIPVKGVVEVPMIHQGELIGVLLIEEVDDPGPSNGHIWRRFTEHDVHLLSLFAAQAASAVHNARLLQETQRRVEELQLLHRASQALNADLSLEKVLNVVADYFLTALQVTSCTISGFDAASDEMVILLDRDPEESVRLAAGTPFQPSEYNWYGTALENTHAKAWRRDDPGLSEATRQGMDAYHWRSLLVVPLVNKGQAVGVVELGERRSERDFGPDAIRLAESLANQAAVALENARLFEETRRRADQLALLNRVASALSQTLDLDQLLEVIYREIKTVLHADAFYIALYDIATDELNYRIRIDEDVREPAERRRLVPGITALVIQSKKPLLIRDWELEKDNYPPLKVWGTMKVPRAWLSVPLIFRDTVVGVVSLQSYRANAFGEEEKSLLVTIADQAAVAVEKARLFTETEHRLQRLHALGDIDKAISSSLDLRVILEVVLEQVATQLHVDAADILLHNPRTQTLSYASGRGFRSRALRYTDLRLGEGFAGAAALERRIVHFPNLTQEENALWRSPLLANEEFVAYFAVPLIAKGAIKGVLEIFHRGPLDPDQEWLDFVQALASQAAIAIDDAELFRDLQHSNVELTLAYDATIEGWSRALELRDRETEGHAARVTQLTLRLARLMGMSDQELMHIRHGALLHDIGKMAIPDGILFKAGALDAAEWEIMRRHPTFAYEMLSPIVYLRQALDVPYCHHEKWDGTGYPRALKGEQIPLAARIFAVVDVWDALCSDRPYRRAWSEEMASAYIRDQAGKHFDPQVVEEFLKLNADLVSKK